MSGAARPGTPGLLVSFHVSRRAALSMRRTEIHRRKFAWYLSGS